MGDYGKNRKKIMFYDTDKRHAELKIRLQHDGITQASFFRMIVSGYLNNNDKIIEFVDEHKESKGLQSQENRKKIKRAISEGKDMERRLGLAEEEVENIFDIIAQEHPDL